MPAFLAVLFFSASSLFADDSLFRQGQMFIDLSYGAGKPESIALGNLTDTSDYQLDSLRLAASTSQQKQLLGFARIQSYQEPQIRSTMARFSFEYAVLNWLGLGFSLNSQKVRISNVYVGPILPVYFYALPLLSSSCDGFINTGPACGPGILDYASSATLDLVSEPIHTADFEVGFHPARGGWDPYFKLAMGAGTWEQNTVTKGSAILGCRIRTAQWLYLFAEGYANHYTVQARTGEGSLVGTDTGGRAGIGFTF